MGKLDGQVAIVTGAARGIGRAYALRLAALGADVVIADLNLEGAARIGETLTAASVTAEVEALGRRSIGVEGDLRDPRTSWRGSFPRRRRRSAGSTSSSTMPASRWRAAAGICPPTPPPRGSTP